MKKYLITIALCATGTLGLQAQSSTAKDTRATFSPSVDRSSPFEFSEKLPEKAPEAAPAEGAMGVAETLKKFIRPTGYISGRTFAENKIYFGGRFYEVDDILQLEVTEGAESYLYPKMELVIRDISDDGLELYHQESATLQKITFSFQPDISPKPGGSNSVPGANIIYVGKDQAPNF
jgi:hypothetical protein